MNVNPWFSTRSETIANSYAMLCDQTSFTCARVSSCISWSWDYEREGLAEAGCQDSSYSLLMLNTERPSSYDEAMWSSSMFLRFGTGIYVEAELSSCLFGSSII